jgi:hypothetical protein
MIKLNRKKTFLKFPFKIVPINYYFYHFVIVITISLSQVDHIKQKQIVSFLLFIMCSMDQVNALIVTFWLILSLYSGIRLKRSL